MLKTDDILKQMSNEELLDLLDDSTKASKGSFEFKDIRAELSRRLETNQSERHYQDRLNRWSVLFDTARDIFFETDDKGIITYLNHGAEQILPFKHSEMINVHFSEFLGNVPEESKAKLTRLPFDIGGMFNMTFYSRSRERGKRWYDLRLLKHEDDDGNITGTTGRLLDITHIIETQEENTILKERYEKIFNESPTGIFKIVNGKIADVNPHMCKMIGYSKSTIMTKNPLDFIHPDDLSSLIDQISSVNPKDPEERKLTHKVESRFLTKTKKVCHAEGYFAIDYDPKIDGYSYLFTVLDVSENVKFNEELRRREATLQAVIESTPDNILVFNRSSELILWDATSEEAFSRNFNHTLKYGEKLFQVMKYKDAEKYQENLHRALSGEISSFQFVTDENLGLDIRHSIVRMRPVQNNKGEIIGAVTVAHEITELKRKEIELEQNRAMLEAIINSSPDGIYATDLKYTLQAINQPAKNDFAKIYKVNLKTGDNLKEKIDPSKFELWEKKYFHRMFNGESFTVEAKFEVDGKSLYIENNYVPVKNSEGLIIGALELSRNITERKEYQEKLEEQEKQYRYIFENSNDAIIYADMDQELIIDANMSAIEMYGCSTLEELEQMEGFERAPEFQLNGERSEDFFEKITKEVLDKGKLKYTFIGQNLLGDTFIGEGISIHDKSSGNNRILYFTKDITDSYLAQTELEKRQGIYEALISNSFEGIDILSFEDFSDVNNVTLVVRNEAMAHMLGTMTETLTSKEAMRDISSPIQSGGVRYDEKYDEIQSTLESENQVGFDWIFNIDGSQIYIEGQVQVIKIEEQFFLIRIFRDVTERQKNQLLIEQQFEDLNISNKELKKYIDSNLQLENFAYIASHDLKAPLRTVGSFADLLAGSTASKLTEKEAKFLKIIQDSSRNMQDLIEDLLRFSRVNTQKINLQNIDVSQIIKELVLENQDVYESIKAEIIVDKLPKSLVADKTKLRQIFQNLMGNALKYRSQERKLKIIISCNETVAFYEFSVRDNGIGIEPEYYDKIFLLFQKLHSADIYEGSGIGLAICKKAIEQHEGRIWLDSTYGEGTTFYFTIPKNLKAH